MFFFNCWKRGERARDNRHACGRQRYRFRPCLEVLEDRLVLSTGVTTSAAAASAVFSTQAQTVSLNASVIDPNNSSDIVNEGTVTFAIVNGSGAAVGNSVQASVSNGMAAATNFSQPGCSDPERSRHGGWHAKDERLALLRTAARL